MLQKHKFLTILILAFASTLLIFTACEKDDDPVAEEITTDDVVNTSPGEPVKDINGNTYKTVWIGDQNWMAENLKTITYNDGTDIDLVTDNTAWINSTTGAYCWYDNDEVSYADTYGALYSSYAVETGNLCPDGWHVPTDEEWKTLEMYLGMSQADADKSNEYRGTNEGSKLAGNASLWNDGALESNNEFGTSGFSALPGGWRDTNGNFLHIGVNGKWWSASMEDTGDAWGRAMTHGKSTIWRCNTFRAGSSFSVRCVKD
ncbi:MAG: fibrobacter succinogenes major paralogous domain-containing protein [Thiohalospira sp.]